MATPPDPEITHTHTWSARSRDGTEYAISWPEGAQSAEISINGHYVGDMGLGPGAHVDTITVGAQAKAELVDRCTSVIEQQRRTNNE